jgi:hypothetical protein
MRTIAALSSVAFLLGWLPPVRVEAMDRASEAYADAENRLASADFDAAATLYEEAARDSTRTCTNDALARAARLRLLLHQFADAKDDIARFRLACGKGEPAAAARLHFALSDVYGSQDDWRRAVAALTAAMPLVDAAHDDELRAVAHARLGHAFERRGDRARASSEFAAVVTLARRRPANAGSWGPDGRDALAEAHYFAAERKLDAMDAIGVPPAAIPIQVTWDMLRTHSGWFDPNTHLHVAYWRRYGPQLQRLRDAERVAEVAYLRVLGIEAAIVMPEEPATCAICIREMPEPRVQSSVDPLDPAWAGDVPSPRWALASLTRIGELRLRLREVDTRMPIPSRGFTMTEATDCDPVPAFRACLRFARHRLLVDAHTATCERGWNRVYAIERLPVDELRPLPDRVPAPSDLLWQELREAER